MTQLDSVAAAKQIAYCFQQWTEHVQNNHLQFADYTECHAVHIQCHKFITAFTLCHVWLQAYKSSTEIDKSEKIIINNNKKQKQKNDDDDVTTTSTTTTATTTTAGAAAATITTTTTTTTIVVVVVVIVVKIQTNLII